MAELGLTASRKGDWITFTWASDDGASNTYAPAYLNHNVSDIMFEASGTFNGSTITLNGFVTDSTVTKALVDVEGQPISTLAEASFTVRDAWPHFVPVSDGAGTSEAIVCVMYAKIVK